MPTESKKLQTTLERSPLADEFPSDCNKFFVASVNAPVVMGLRSTASRKELENDARIAQELMDPARKKPETPLEHEQREVIWKLVEAIHDECAEYGGYLLPTLKALDAAAPYLEED